MIVESVISDFNTSVYWQRRYIVFCFLMFLSANFILTANTLQDETKYEQSENSPYENTEEENSLSDNDPSISAPITTDYYSEKPHSCFELQEYFLSFKPDIHIPPPEL